MIEAEVKTRIKLRDRQQKEKEKSRQKESRDNIQDTAGDIVYDYPTSEDVKKWTFEFEKRNKALLHGRCDGCRMSKLQMKTKSVEKYGKKWTLCTTCVRHGVDTVIKMQESMPVWTDDCNQLQFYLPKELADLREGEKLILQRLSTYIPVHHLYKGQMGSKGHCAAFKQNIGCIWNVLPRLPKDVQFIQVIKTYKDSNDEVGEKMFVIRKKETLQALYWLRRNNRHYADVQIDESRLDWIVGEEQELENDNNTRVGEEEEKDSNAVVSDGDSTDSNDSTDHVNKKQKNNKSCTFATDTVGGHEQQDVGPSRSQVYDIEMASEDIAYTNEGVIEQTGNQEPDTQFDSITAELQTLSQGLHKHSNCKSNFPYLTSVQRQGHSDAVVTQDDASSGDDDLSGSNVYTKDTIQFPEVDAVAVNEYDTSIDVFGMSFPWLFPGGRGGPFDIRPTKLSLVDWLELMIMYEDGRFCRDKAFAFYALNFVNRHTNAKQGKYYVNKFDTNFECLEDLQKADHANMSKWISKLTYFCSSFKGSDAYWQTQRNKIYTWINHHIAEDNGPPSMFITLSCAEYYWPDISRLLTNRFECMGADSPLSQPYTDGRVNTVRNVNDYTIVVQEYFQQRVENWLKTVGKHIFKIDHYWLRYEFAPSRGQIHAHMLAISTEQNKLLQKVANKYRPMKSRGAILGKWMQDSFNMTASIPTIDTAGITVDVQLTNCTDAHNQKASDMISDQKTSAIPGLSQKRTRSQTNTVSKTGSVPTKEFNFNHPSNHRFADLNVQQNTRKDQTQLLLLLQNHKCSAYCMRKRRLL